MHRHEESLLLVVHALVIVQCLFPRYLPTFADLIHCVIAEGWRVMKTCNHLPATNAIEVDAASNMTKRAQLDGKKFQYKAPL